MTVERIWRPPWSVTLPVGSMLGSLRHGSRDPAFRTTEDGVHWLAINTPVGPATLSVAQAEAGVALRAWGEGGTWALDNGPALLGATDEVSGFEPHHPRVADSWRRHRAHRLPRTLRVWEALLAAVLEQRVTGKESSRAWQTLLRRYGEPAPGGGDDGPVPTGMWVPPLPRRVRAVPDWDWHRMGVDGQRRRAVQAVAVVGESLERGADHVTAAELTRRLTSVPGIGPWTAAETVQRALGDPDSVSVGDYHLASFVGWALTGAPVDDDGMLELLEPYRGHRYRAVRLLEISGFTKPRFGPRMTITDMRSW